MNLLFAALSSSPVLLAAVQTNSEAIISVHQNPVMSGSSSLGTMLTNGSGVFWTLTYIIVIVHGFREKRPMMPAIAILLNISWEVLAVLEWASYSNAMRYGAVAWLIVDVLIIYQLLKFGRAHQTVWELKRFWVSIVAGGFLVALGWHHFFSIYNGDQFGLEDSYLINLVMSILFIGMYFRHWDASKLARWIAWTKMIGTACASVGLILIIRSLDPPFPRSMAFLYYLMVACFVFDMIYIGLLTKGRAAHGDTAPVPAPA